MDVKIPLDNKVTLLRLVVQGWLLRKQLEIIIQERIIILFIRFKQEVSQSTTLCIGDLALGPLRFLYNPLGLLLQYLHNLGIQCLPHAFPILGEHYLLLLLPHNIDSFHLKYD
jgi:hypothetical protein